MAAGHEDRLALIELLDRDGHARTSVAVTRWPVTIGRAIDCDVVLDDPHVAAHHVTLAEDESGTLRLHAGESINGVALGRQTLTAGMSAPVPAVDATLQLGATRVRIRRAGAPLAPEQPMQRERALPWWGLTLLAAVLVGWVFARRWLETDPGEPAIEYLAMLFGVPAGVLVWSALWALGSKIFRHHFEFWPHLRIALVWMLVLFVAEFVLHALAYMLSWSWASRVSGEVQTAIGALWLYSHLAQVVPQRRRALAIGVATLFVAGSLIGMGINYQRQDRFFDELYMAALGPPALRIAPTQSTQAFLQDADRLRERLDALARPDKEDETADEEAAE